jgi:hypothetical protein
LFTECFDPFSVDTVEIFIITEWKYYGSSLQHSVGVMITVIRRFSNKKTFRSDKIYIKHGLILNMILEFCIWTWRFNFFCVIFFAHSIKFRWTWFVQWSWTTISVNTIHVTCQDPFLMVLAHPKPIWGIPDYFEVKICVNF